ncbi:hypothetical protein [Actinophytocola sp.]|uniref:hypothetical protein n=1 Tax=Actinophytocola sp. TaxID=1872138 RepID=UPI002D80E96F|nr:hypothetical protein [Actinophytocola sp.]HET9144143.1 hypothetical protein [Actinophytocola sp.]
MTETRSNYFALPRYSADSDEVMTRADWEEAATRIEERAAYDDGTSNAALPATLLKPGRYTRQDLTDGYAIHRRSASAWEWIGGTIAPVRVRYRAAAPGDTVLSVDQGADASTKLTVTGAGDVTTTGAYAGAYGMIAADGEAVDAAVRGRLYVRTKADGERGVVLRPHGAGAGYMLAAEDTGGSIVTTLDSVGRLQQRSFSAFGGATIPTTQTVAVAPTNADDSVNGLLVHGWGDSVTPAIANKPVLRVREIASGNDLLVAAKNSLVLGRTGWTGAVIDLKAPTINLTGAAVATSLASGPLTTFGNAPAVVTSSLASITSPVTNMYALLTTDLVWYRYTGAVWAAMMPMNGGTTNATRHEARYAQTVALNVPSTANAFTTIAYAADVECSDVSPSGPGSGSGQYDLFTLNRGGRWTISAAGGYSGSSNGVSGTRRVLMISDTNDGPTAKFLAGNSAWPAAGHAAQLNASVTRRFPAGQTIRVLTFQDVGQTLALVTDREGGYVTFAWEGS